MVKKLPTNTIALYNYRMNNNPLLDNSEPEIKTDLSKSKPITLKQVALATLGFLLANLIAGYGVVLLGVDIQGIYNTLSKPYFAPPTWVFGIAWTINNILVIYGILRTVNLPASLDRSRLLGIDTLIIVNYLVFQYLSFGSGVLFGKIIPFMFFLPTFSMFLLTVLALIKSYLLDTKDMSIWSKILSGKSIFASYWSLFGWLIIACGLGFGIWVMN
jgi:tryptophan-rich sensory protein